MIGPSVAALVVLGRVYWWIFVVSQYALLRFAFGRGVAASSAAWLALPGAFLSWHITYTEFGELFAFSGSRCDHRGAADRTSSRQPVYGLRIPDRIGLLEPRPSGHGGRSIGRYSRLPAGCRASPRRRELASRWYHDWRLTRTRWMGPGLSILPLLLFGTPTDPSLAAIALRLVDVSRQALPVLFMGHWRPVEVTPALGTALASLVLLSCVWGLVAIMHVWRATGRRPPPSPKVTVRILLAAIALWSS